MKKTFSTEYVSCVYIFSNRVEAWTRDVDFLLRQEGRPMVNLTGDRKHVRVMEADWRNTDKAVNWIKEEAINLTQPFVLYLGLNLPHPYPSPYAGENFGSSTFLTSPYWLEKVCEIKFKYKFIYNFTYYEQYFIPHLIFQVRPSFDISVHSKKVPG